MSDSPFRSPAKAPSTPPSPPGRRRWTAVLGCAAFLWLLVTHIIVFTLIGIYDPRRDDGLPPEEFGWWCFYTGAEWIVLGTLIGFAFFKIRRIVSRPRDAAHRSHS